MNPGFWLRVGAIWGFLAVSMGAFCAHLLKQRFQDLGEQIGALTAQRLEDNYHTAAQYHMYCALALWPWAYWRSRPRQHGGSGRRVVILVGFVGFLRKPLCSRRDRSEMARSHHSNRRSHHADRLAGAGRRRRIHYKAVAWLIAHDYEHRRSEVSLFETKRELLGSRQAKAGRRFLLHAACTCASRFRVPSSWGSSKICPGGPDSMTRPSPKTWTVWATRRANCMACVTTIMVSPVAGEIGDDGQHFGRHPRIERLVGSSKRIARGSIASAGQSQPAAALRLRAGPASRSNGRTSRPGRAVGRAFLGDVTAQSQDVDRSLHHVLKGRPVREQIKALEHHARSPADLTVNRLIG